MNRVKKVNSDIILNINKSPIFLANIGLKNFLKSKEAWYLKQTVLPFWNSQDKTYRVGHKIRTSLYKLAWINLARDTETLAALTYSMANRCEAIIAADGMQKYQLVLG